LTSVYQLEQAICRLDAKLRRIAKTPPIDIATPGWSKRLPQPTIEPYRSPLDRAGVRAEADRLIADTIAFYAAAPDGEREAIRALFRVYDSFAWASGWDIASPKAPMTREQLRTALLLFSIKDQGRDWRDAIVWLDSLCAQGLRAQLPLAELLTEIAALSSDTVRFAMFEGSRSTRVMLLAYGARFPSTGARAPS